MLVTAEGIQSITLEKISNADSTLSACFLVYLQNRIKEKSNKTLIHLVEYLHDPIFLIEAKTETFHECAKGGSTLLLQLCCKGCLE